LKVLKYKKKEAKEWIQENFTGDIPTMITSFKENGEVDYDAMRFNFRHILKFGTDGYAVNAYAGEQDALTEEEKIKIFELTVEEAHRNKVFAMTSVIGCLEDTLERIKHAEDIGGDAVWLSGPPGAPGLSEEGVYQWYKYIADRTNIALAIFYSDNISPRTVARLAAECPNIVSKKTCPPSLAEAMLREMKAQTLFMPFHSAFTCVLAGLVPPKLASFVNADLYAYNTTTDHIGKKCWELAKKGDLKKAADMFYSEPLNSRREWMITLRGENNPYHSSGIAKIPIWKYWHELMGFRGGIYCRLPYLPPTAAEKRKMKADMIRLGYLGK
jgi:4-hydroxy-2-oxoglutarate aldolase